MTDRSSARNRASIVRVGRVDSDPTLTHLTPSDPTDPT